jgi:peptide/nickel transport system permease protein
MATRTTHDVPIVEVSHSRRASYHFMREVPVIPLLILLTLGLAALFAPVLAPYGKLQPVPVSDEQCKAKYGRSFRGCYIDDDPPFFMQGSILRTALGTDYLGRDNLSRLMYGARISLVVSLTGTVAAGAIGTLLGILAGYMGRLWDQVIMRITDAWLTLPTLVFAILLASIRGPGLWNVVLILAVVFWSRYARLVRGEVLTLRERDFVRLAEVNGVSKWHIILRHLLPNVMNTVMVFFTLIVGVAIIIEANLSFLGVGVPPPEPAWGLMISQEREALMEGKWWLAAWPGLCIMLLVLSANMLGDWLRVRLDPQLRNR